MHGSAYFIDITIIICRPPHSRDAVILKNICVHSSSAAHAASTMKTLLSIYLSCLGAGILFAHASDGFGLDPSKELYQYSHRIWQKKDGLPQNSVHAIVQTRDGYLWFATDEGLARFDGLQFRVYTTRTTPQFKNNQVRSLCEAQDGTLWIGFTDGGIVSFASGIFTRFTKEPSFLNTTVWNIFKDHSNTLWFSSPVGVLHVVPSDSTHVLLNEASGLPYMSVTSVAEDSSGTIMACTKFGISMLRNGRFVQYPSMAHPARGLFRDSGGTMRFIAGYNSIAQLNRDSSVSYSGAKERFHTTTVLTLFRDRAGTLWIGTGGMGLFRYAMGKYSSFSAEDGLSSTFAETFFEDREGNLWVGTTGGGLNRFTNTKFTTYLPSASPAMVWSVYQDQNGAIWGGGEPSLLLRLEKRKFVPAFVKGPSFTSAPTAILHDRSDVLWAGTRSGLYRIPAWRKSVLTSADYTYKEFGPVNAIMEDRRGDVWVGTLWHGLQRYRNGKHQPWTTKDSLKFSDVCVVSEDRRGDLWVGTSSHGVARLHDGKFVVYDSSNGMPSLHVMAIHEDAEGMVWFGTLNGGLVRWNGKKFTKLSYAQNMFDETIFSIQEDSLGCLWMSSNNGVFRVAKKILNDAADGTIASIVFDAYGMSNGMRSDECNGGFGNAGVTSTDGTMWFPTTVGYVMVDPQSLPVNRVPPSVAIELFSADKKTVAPSPRAEIDPGAGVLEFTYAGLSFTASDKVRFKVLLEGFDAEWIDVGTRRFVSYTNIPPGSYRFRVIAANSDGVWNDTGAALAFTLLPHFYQTYWFYILCFAAIALSGAVAHKVYRRSKDRTLIASRRQAQLEARLKESQLLSLSMQLQPHFLFNTLNSISSLMHFDVDRADSMIAHLGQLLRISLDRMRRQEVPLRQELEFLESYLCIEQSRLGDRLTVIRNIEEAALPALVPSMVWQPLVENAIKHGIAPRKTGGVLTLGARRIGTDLELTIHDNGEGMGRSVPTSSNGVGIRNTMERLELLYPSSHEILFADNSEGGVTVTLRIPFRNEEYETDDPTEESRSVAARYPYRR